MKGVHWNGTTDPQIEGQSYWGGTPVEYYDNGYAHFESLDWTGTKRMSTSNTGAVEVTYGSYLFGDGLAVLSGSDYDGNHYAGMDADNPADMSHAKYRQYSDIRGQWYSPDPYLGSYDPSNPQSMNRYSYAMNNPLSFVDPDGTEIYSDYGNDPVCDGGMSGGGAGGYAGDMSNDPWFGNCCGLLGGNDVLYCGDWCGLVGQMVSGADGGEFTLEAGVNGFVWINDYNGEEVSQSGAEEVGLPTPDFGSGPAPGGAGGESSGCTDKILSAINNHFGTNFNSSDVGRGAHSPFQWPQVLGGTWNIDVIVPMQDQPDGISPGRYPVNWWTYAIGFGPTLHIPAGPGGLDSPSTLILSCSQFTAHLDSAYPYNPIGLLAHVSEDVLGIGGHNPCPY